jgi:HicB family
MNLTSYVERLQTQLGNAAGAAGEQARELAGLLGASLDSATRLVLLEALSAAADEITRELAPGAVEVRLRGGEPEFVVDRPPTEDEFAEIPAGPTSRFVGDPAESDEGGTARLNLRLPATLKRRIDDAAASEGLSLNAWLVRAAGAALDAQGWRRGLAGGDRYTGWIR